VCTTAGVEAPLLRNSRQHDEPAHVVPWCELAILSRAGGSAEHSTRRRFVLSYDLWEERFAVSLMGTVPIPLPLWRTSELQLSMSFSNLAVPAVGGMAAQIRFLQKQGCDLASAVASGAVLANAANIFANILLLGAHFVLSPTSIRTGRIPRRIVDVMLVVIACHSSSKTSSGSSRSCASWDPSAHQCRRRSTLRSPRRRSTVIGNTGTR
jgi:hypothetical protein